MVGNDSICTTLLIRSDVNVEQYGLEISLHVVIDNYSKYDVLIGRNIKSGLYCTIDAEKLSIAKTK